MQRTLLSQAMGIVQTNLIQETVKKNIAAVSQLNKMEFPRSYKTGADASLAIAPFINGNPVSGDYSFAPLAVSDLLQVNLHEIKLSADSFSYSAPSLYDKIRQTCLNNQIDCSNLSSVANLMPMTVLLAGKHDQTDPQCLDVTAADFAPAYLNESTEVKRVLALSYRVNSDSSQIQEDFLAIPANGKAPLLGARNGHNKTQKAIQIPNEISATVDDKTFGNLQKNGVIVVLLDIKATPRQQPRLNKTGFNFEGFITTKSSDQEVDKRNFRCQGGEVSAYAVTTEGSKVQNHLQTQHEDMIYSVASVNVFAISPMVFSVDPRANKEISLNQPETLQLMKGKTLEIAEIHKPFYTPYQHMISELNKCLPSQHSLRVSNTHFLAYALLQLAGLPGVFVEKFGIGGSTKTPENFYMDFGISQEYFNAFVFALKVKFGNNFCDAIPAANQGDGTFALRFSLAEFKNNFSAITTEIAKLLANPTLLQTEKEAQKSGRSEAHKVWAASRLENLALAIEGFIDHPDIMPSLALYPSAMELAANIRNLASEILKPRYFETDTKTAVFSLKQSLSFFQSRLTTPEAVDIFKTGPKEFIQQIERDMALVPPRTKKM